MKEVMMAGLVCSACSHENPHRADHCEACGRVLDRSVAPIALWSGKFKVAGVFIMAIGVIGMTLGTWWGPPALLPGLAFYMMGRFF